MEVNRAVSSLTEGEKEAGYSGPTGSAENEM